MALPIYKLTIDPNDDTGVVYNAFVDAPAHMKVSHYFGLNQKGRYEFNEEARTVIGVMISAETLIYREDQEFGKHQVVFDDPTITAIKEKFHKLGYNNNVNEMHNLDKVVDSVFMTASYQIGGNKRPSAPEIFADQNLKSGTWIAEYKVNNDDIWAKVKSGEFQGFSVEGDFFKEQMTFKSQTKKQTMSKKTKFNWLTFSFEEVQEAEETFTTVKNSDGKEMTYEGELAEKTAISIVQEDGSKLPAPAGNYEITLGDGTKKAITVDETGLILTVADVESPSADMEAMRKEFAERLEKTTKVTMEANDERFKALEENFIKVSTENATLKTQLETFATTGKFNKEVKAPETGSGISYRDHMNAQKNKK